jgi:hypothetical protein
VKRWPRRMAGTPLSAAGEGRAIPGAAGSHGRQPHSEQQNEQTDYVLADRGFSRAGAGQARARSAE